MKVKIFKDTCLEGLEASINRWLIKNPNIEGINSHSYFCVLHDLRENDITRIKDQWREYSMTIFYKEKEA